MKPLTEVMPGRTVRVVEVRTRHPRRRETLALYGIVPGAAVELLQRFPALVVRVGETWLSLDDEVGAEICVECVEEGEGGSRV